MIETNSLVSTDWMANHLEDNNITVVEVNSHPEKSYFQSHIPSAILWDLHKDLEDPIKRDIPSGTDMEKLLGKSGITNETTIILYGDGNNRSATWAFWLLKFYRHKKIKLIDGGRIKWLIEGKPVIADIPKSDSANYQIKPPDKSIRATLPYITKNLYKNDLRIIDTRTIEEYLGEMASSPGTPQTGISKNGRIPNSVNIQWTDCINPDGTVKSSKVLSKMFGINNALPENEIIAYCRLGVRASYTWFVLHEILNYENVKNYDGSWTEWGNSIGTPIEIGPPIK